MKNNKMKRVVTAMLASVMLLGMSVTVNAQSAGAAGKDTHVHEYFPHRSYYNSYTVGTHSYLVGIEHHEDGSEKKIYATCSRVIYFYNLVYKCAYDGCDASYVSGGGQEIRHMQCGAPNE